MNQLEPTILNGKRVLTTAQLAGAYGTEPRIINNNFGRNISRYKAEKHYFLLEGTDLKEFKRNHQFDEALNRVNKLYLWSEKGAWFHAKSLNTDRAWDAYEMLVDEYYTIQENVVPLSKDQALVTVLRTTADLVEGHESIIKEQHEIRKLISQVDQKVDEQITLDYGEQRRLQKGVATKVYEVCDDPQLRPKLFRELYREIKDRFGVASYKDVKRKELQAALRYIENWIPRKVS
ncbi:antirepressor [Niallia circulans]|uniref:Antirepressor n=1 Tax=Niallia circulans TaxID=1397 RepID=A0A0J1L223_NIACI|nr:ORF6C domain-containing protein [Niallia circulans]KLV23045.1 antirepressor [Niallia circulans]